VKLGVCGIAMMFTMILFWGLMIVLVFLGLRWFFGQGKVSPSGSPLDILRQRYARGEINKEEFEAKKKDLN